jgi:hypothetical protein
VSAGDADLETAYAAEMERVTESGHPTVRARAIRLYLDGASACEIAIVLGRTTTASSITGHLRDAGLGGVHWCSLCRTPEQA